MTRSENYGKVTYNVCKYSTNSSGTLQMQQGRYCMFKYSEDVLLIYIGVCFISTEEFYFKLKKISE